MDRNDYVIEAALPGCCKDGIIKFMNNEDSMPPANTILVCGTGAGAFVQIYDGEVWRQVTPDEHVRANILHSTLLPPD